MDTNTPSSKSGVSPSATSHQPLPPFSMRAFAQNIAMGIQVQQHEQSRIHAQKLAAREEATKHFTTPGLRPLAEPPILDWEWFMRVHVPSDRQYLALFPDDAEKRARMKDVEGERNMLGEYREWVKNMRNDEETDEQRKGFYEGLGKELWEDWLEVDQECTGLARTATELGRFEKYYLDSDGQTLAIEAAIAKGADVFMDWGSEVREKYGYLQPEGFVENVLASFEFAWLDREGGTTVIQRHMERGEDIVEAWEHPEIEEKYGYLRALRPQSQSGEDVGVGHGDKLPVPLTGVEKLSEAVEEDTLERPAVESLLAGIEDTEEREEARQCLKVRSQNLDAQAI